MQPSGYPFRLEQIYIRIKPAPQVAAIVEYRPISNTCQPGVEGFAAAPFFDEPLPAAPADAATVPTPLVPACCINAEQLDGGETDVFMPAAPWKLQASTAEFWDL